MSIQDVRTRMVVNVRFTLAEFETMVNELLFQKPISFDMLCRIAEKTLKPSVKLWCNSEECLRGRGYEDDIMQEIYLRLIKTTVDYFLLRDDIAGTYNNDPEGFEDWMFRVADNLKRNFAKRIRNRDFKTKDIDEPVLANIPSDDFDDSDIEEHFQRLKQAFSTVLSSEVGIYKILTWIAQFLFILEYDVTKIKSTEMMLETFENKTLYDMYKMILMASKNISWIVITEEQNEKILNSLRKTYKDNVSYGEIKYKEFFMKHNGKISGKKSISDWINRMNSMIKKKNALNNDVYSP